MECIIQYASTGLYTFSSKWPWLPATVMAVWFPNTWQQTMVIASHCVGLTLPGMIDEPGSFSGSISSPRPERGPEPNKRISFAILNRPVAIELMAPCANTYASLEASASNLLGALVNGSLVILATCFANVFANFGFELRPVPTAVPPCASL